MTDTAAPPDVTTDTRLLDELVAEAMERLHVPGLAVGIIHGDREIAAGYGVTSVEHPQPVGADTLFQIGSTTKTVTGTTVMRLVEDGTIDLDAPVRTYLPGLRLVDEDVASRVTMRHLLTHTAGWVGDYFFDTGRGDDALERMAERMADLPQVTPLGEVWSYNNASFYLAGRIIEVVTGKPYELAARELVLEPLGMNESYFFPEEVMTYSFAAGHQIRDGRAELVRPWALARSANAAGGLASSIRDQLRYARFHLGDGTAGDGTRVLQPATVAEMQREQAPARSIADAIGITWRITYLNGVRVVGHGGGTLGQASAFELVPERDFAISVLTNTRDRTILDEIVGWALRHFLGVSQPERIVQAVPPEQLAEYTGIYTAQGSDAELSVRDGALYVQLRPKGGFPTPDVPPPPAPPPYRIDFFTEDRVFNPDTPAALWWGEFLRKPDGSILGFHTGGRLLVRSHEL
jgi:CubicO group peptidase (beta-lactamase class C family)